MKWIKESVEMPEDILTIDEMIQAELRKAFAEKLFIKQMFVVHEMLFGVPCGPTLSMVNPERLGYGGWIGYGS